MHQSFYKLIGSKRGIIKNIIKNSYLGCAMAFNKKILKKSLPFPRDIPMHDCWIGMISEIFGKVYFIEDKLISYRWHKNNVSVSGKKSVHNLFKKINFRHVLIKNLIKRKFCKIRSN